MLLRNESRVRHFVEINLTYDDKESNNLIVNEGDNVAISFRKNGRIAMGEGKITEIKVQHRARCNGFGMKETAILEIDMSGDCNSQTESVDIRDIIDIRKLVPKHCHKCDKVDPSFIVKPKDKDTIGVVVMPISTCVVIGD